MKNILVCSLLLLGAYNSASAGGRCGMSEGSPCRDFYKKFDAFKKLQENENSDAQANLALVESIQKKLNLNLEYVVDNFIYVQQSIGGVNSTSTAQDAFKLIANEVYGRNQLHEVADRFVELLRAENDIDDAKGNFSLVAREVRSGHIWLQSGTKLFLSILNLEGGSNSTSKAQDTFKLIITHKKKFPLKGLLESYQSLLRNENERDDAVGNFKLVLLAAEICGSLEQATSDFLGVLKQLGGPNNTVKARELFKNLYEM